MRHQDADLELVIARIEFDSELEGPLLAVTAAHGVARLDYICAAHGSPGGTGLQQSSECLEGLQVSPSSEPLVGATRPCETVDEGAHFGPGRREVSQELGQTGSINGDFPVVVIHAEHLGMAGCRTSAHRCGRLSECWWLLARLISGGRVSRQSGSRPGWWVTSRDIAIRPAASHGSDTGSECPFRAMAARSVR
jgi:hypothetical protein